MSHFVSRPQNLSNSPTLLHINNLHPNYSPTLLSHFVSCPIYVVILAGINDIALNNGYISLENILGNIQSMCEIARAHKIKPVICSVLPADRIVWRPEVKKPAEIVIKMNEMLQAYAKSEKIQYVDYHSVLKDENNGLSAQYAYDGLHPTLECYKIMEQIILQHL